MGSNETPADSQHLPRLVWLDNDLRNLSLCMGHFNVKNITFIVHVDIERCMALINFSVGVQIDPSNKDNSNNIDNKNTTKQTKPK